MASKAILARAGQSGGLDGVVGSPTAGGPQLFDDVGIFAIEGRGGAKLVGELALGGDRIDDDDGARPRRSGPP